MQREPFDSSGIRAAGDDPAPCTREVEFRNHRIYRSLDVPPEEWIALEAAESAGAYVSAHIRTAGECGRLVNRVRARHQQAAPL